MVSAMGEGLSNSGPEPPVKNDVQRTNDLQKDFNTLIKTS